MTLDTLIQMALDGVTGEPMYAAYAQVLHAAANDRGQVLDVRTLAAAHVIKYDILLLNGTLTDGGRHILEALLHTGQQEEDPCTLP